MSLEILRQFIPSSDELEPDASRQVLDHFGADAPGVLNAYACRLEDLLLEQQKSVLKLRDELHLLREDNKRLRTLIQVRSAAAQKQFPVGAGYSAFEGLDPEEIPF